MEKLKVNHSKQEESYKIDKVEQDATVGEHLLKCKFCPRLFWPDEKDKAIKHATRCGIKFKVNYKNGKVKEC